LNDGPGILDGLESPPVISLASFFSIPLSIKIVFVF